MFLHQVPVNPCRVDMSSSDEVCSVERYCGICYPVQSRVRGRRRRLALYLAPVLLFRSAALPIYCYSLVRPVLCSLLFNVPKFLEIAPGGGVGDLAYNEDYDRLYRQYTELAVTVLIPLTALLFLNCRIYCAVRFRQLRSVRHPSKAMESDIT